MARKAKTKLTPEVQEKILLHLRVGAYVETAAVCAGISKDTFYDWMKKGARGQKPYVAFAEAVHKAVAESESRDLATILKASTKYWVAAAWRLERRFPEKYGRFDRMKVEGKIEHDGASLVAKLAQLINGDPEPKKRSPAKDDTKPK
jgi:transposase